MSILSDFEDRISGAVEGVFGSVFRSPVQPAEIAKGLAKEMDRGRIVAVERVWAPNVFTVYLSPEDDRKLGAFVDTLAIELAAFLAKHAREKRYAVASTPIVRFAVDDELKLGRFDVEGDLVSAEELREQGEYEDYSDDDSDAPPVVAAPVGAFAEHEMPVGVAAPARRGDSMRFRKLATLTVKGIEHDVALEGERMTIGRLAACDISLQDANVSREHAALVSVPEGWAIQDLESRNGTFVNGRAVKNAILQEGDTIRVGVTELVYRDPRVES